MSVQPLNDLWEAAAGQPYEPTIGKDSQFSVGITLLFTDPSLKNLPLIGLPASLAAGFGAVYMICAVGVYV
ncbi:hypothetical protein E4T42_03457 [Aureobasidium subglaciale]|nr:hypothetical protein E4T38_02654 [Aureobasidium subglaciale]KAI5227523.1 hypothetical protein E4T40_02521 [Aureobasidium subglaciale]KAI5230991.1 hypothetical protein E4T41_02653 [Aureobasidium subglaciale]KAI5252405.1 hypothetical protein E4T42_03457 [Aureobasidium subglaciale]KAI5265204.1 hypothetical protein E4T46_02431 [Aureobasidium subglaciale]